MEGHKTSDLILILFLRIWNAVFFKDFVLYITGKSFCGILDEICTSKVCPNAAVKSGSATLKLLSTANISIDFLEDQQTWFNRLSASKIVLHVSKVVEVPITETLSHLIYRIQPAWPYKVMPGLQPLKQRKICPQNLIRNISR